MVTYDLFISQPTSNCYCSNDSFSTSIWVRMMVLTNNISISKNMVSGSSCIRNIDMIKHNREKRLQENKNAIMIVIPHTQGLCLEKLSTLDQNNYIITIIIRICGRCSNSYLHKINYRWYSPVNSKMGFMPYWNGSTDIP